MSMSTRHSGHIYKRMFNGSWTGWADMGGGFVGNPYAVQYGSDMNLFARGTKNQIYHRYWSYGGQFWSGSGSLGGNLASDPFALQYGSSELDVFATGTDGKTDHDTFHSDERLGRVLRAVRRLEHENVGEVRHMLIPSCPLHELIFPKMWSYQLRSNSPL